jgi:hypothetical protein
VPQYTEEGYQAWLTTQKVKNADLEHANDEFARMRKDHPPANMLYLKDGWFHAAAKQMATNAKNSVVRNFAKRLRTHVLEKYKLTAALGHEVLNGVFAQTFESVPVRVADPIIFELRTKIPRSRKGKVSWYPQDLLPMFHEFLRFIEESNKKNEDDPDYVVKRTFSLLPTKQGFESSHCKVDSTGLRSLLLRSPRVDRALTVVHDGVVWTLGESLAKTAPWIKLSGLWWRRLFFVDKLEKSGTRSFHREITTDGYAVGVHMNREEGEEEERQRREDGED